MELIKARTIKRIYYLPLIFLTIAFGLASRLFGVFLPQFIASYAGDALWAMLIYWGIRFCFPDLKMSFSLVFTLAITFAVELIQLIPFESLHLLLRYQMHALTFGFGFVWTDLVCYWSGAALAVILDFFFNSKAMLSAPSST
ncbi:MAG: DUF2809 domain-containing protein [Cytophagales bacterium]|nr:DUF2809 domain-containing protein [Cytophagales bacterium]